MSEKRELIDTWEFRPVITEGKENPLFEVRGKDLVARGEFARADRPTDNGRLYPAHIWQREIGRLRKLMANNQLFGELDHPQDGKTKLNRVSHMITDLSFDGAVVNGEARIIDKTPAGAILRAIFEAGGVVGVSSRGYGSVKKSPDGYDVVQNDYKLVSFDFVADPANATSLPTITTEDKTASGTVQHKKENIIMNVEELKKQYPELYRQVVEEAKGEAKRQEQSLRESIREELRGEFKRQVLEAVKAERRAIEEEIRSEYESDPDIAGAKAIVERLRDELQPYMLSEEEQDIISAKEDEIERLVEELSDTRDRLDTYEQAADHLMSIAESLAYELYVERTVGKIGDRDVQDRIIALMGDVGRFESFEDLKEALATVVESVADDLEARSEIDDVAKEKDEEIARLREAMTEAQEVAKQFALRAYFEQEISGDPRAVELRKLFEQYEPENEKEVDALIEAYTDTHPLSEDYERIAGSLGGGVSHEINEDFDTGSGDIGGMTVAGVPVRELLERANA